MKSLFLQPALLLLIGLLACNTPDEQRSADQHRPDSLIRADTTTMPDPASLSDGENQLTGLLRTSGLQPQEAKALGLSQQVQYQLISQQAYFLEGSDSLQYFVGQCVTLSGQLVEDWPQQPVGQTTYGRRLFQVRQITPQLFTLCHYSDSTATQPQGREVTYKGTVARMQRPAPDISYDYQLQLQEPYRDENHPIAPGQLVRSLPLVPANFEVLSQLENAIRSGAGMQLKGVQHQGYAEQQAVWVQEVLSHNL